MPISRSSSVSLELEGDDAVLAGVFREDGLVLDIIDRARYAFREDATVRVSRVPGAVGVS